MKKTFYIILILIFSNIAKADLWSCEIEDKANTTAYFESSNETFWLQSQNEKIELINQLTISTWQMPKDKCQINSSFDRNNSYDMYSLNYRCSFKVGGSLQLDFKALEGFYREDLYQGNTRHMYFLKNCQKH